MELSPEDIRKDKNKIIPEDLIVYIHFEDFCVTCNPYDTEIEDLCPACVQEIGEETLNEWRRVKQVIAEHDFPDYEAGHRVLAGVDPQLEQSTLETQLQFNPEYYRIYTPHEIEEAENMVAQQQPDSDRPARRVTQKKVSFPAKPEEINREMLTPLNAHATEDSDGEAGQVKRFGIIEEEKTAQVPQRNEPARQSAGVLLSSKSKDALDRQRNEPARVSADNPTTMKIESRPEVAS